MADNAPEKTEYRADSEYSAYPEYNRLQEKPELPPEYNDLKNDRPTEYASDAFKAKRSLLRTLIVSAFKGGAAVLCVLILIGAIAASHRGDMGETSEELGQRVEAAQRPAVEDRSGFSPAAFAQLWSGDPDGPHNYDLTDPVSLRKATCNEDGAAEYQCRDCGTRWIETLPATGHDPRDPVRENSLAPDCTHEGHYDEVVRCGTCGEELSRTSVMLAALGHQAAEPVHENEVEATCTKEGAFDEVIYCKVCGAELSREAIQVEARLVQVTSGGFSWWL